MTGKALALLGLLALLAGCVNAPTEGESSPDPLIEITTPFDGQVIAQKILTVNVDAADLQGGSIKVTAGSQVQEGTGKTYEFLLLEDGPYAITVQLLGLDGKVRAHHSVNVTLNAGLEDARRLPTPAILIASPLDGQEFNDGENVTVSYIIEGLELGEKDSTKPNAGYAVILLDNNVAYEGSSPHELTELTPGEHVVTVEMWRAGATSPLKSLSVTITVKASANTR